MTAGAPSANGRRNGKNGRTNTDLVLREIGRGLVPGLTSPFPMGAALPSIYQEDDFAMRFVSAFDEVLAPVITALDNVDAYLDPTTAPEDYLDWLAFWVGIELDETWPMERRRQLVSRAVDLYRWRGTVKGLAETVAIYTGAEPEILESGGMVWSTTPGTPFPGKAKPEVTVRLRVKDPSTIDVPRLERLVEAAKPAHILAKVEVLAA
jgi:phage tail-like protein